ncbi:hypothetical protein Syun_025790 [Stephania yunnanensis]|uniref:Uncharacterized protein n=1 Tax=Stephania yunnanensis TaxID=152371 RepID=A0AAP0HWH1_9MAGN
MRIAIEIENPLILSRYLSPLIPAAPLSSHSRRLLSPLIAVSSLLSFPPSPLSSHSHRSSLSLTPAVSSLLSPPSPHSSHSRRFLSPLTPASSLSSHSRRSSLLSLPSSPLSSHSRRLLSPLKHSHCRRPDSSPSSSPPLSLSPLPTAPPSNSPSLVPSSDSSSDSSSDEDPDSSTSCPLFSFPSTTLPCSVYTRSSSLKLEEDLEDYAEEVAASAGSVTCSNFLDFLMKLFSVSPFHHGCLSPAWHRPPPVSPASLDDPSL